MRGTDARWLAPTTTALALAWVISLGLPACSGGDSTGDGTGDETSSTGDTGTTGDTDETGATQTGADGNLAPTALITFPDDGQVVAEGDPVAFTGTITDDRDVAADMLVTWTSNLDGGLDAPAPNGAGVSTFESSALSAGTHVIRLTALDSGGLSGSDEVTLIVNGPPGQAQVTIAPAAPRTGDDLSASVAADAVDPNREASDLTYAYSWLQDGEETGNTTTTVLAQQTTKGEVWTVEVRADDGIAVGQPASVQVTIGNTPPSCTSAVVLPNAGGTDATFTCSCAGREDADPDDPEDDTCEWFDGGVSIGSGCTLDSADTEKGMSLTCVVTPGDGDGDGESVESGDVAVLNTAPTQPTVSLDPITGKVGTWFTCDVLSESEDLDGDTWCT